MGIIPFSLIDSFDNEADWCILFRDNLSYLFELINKMCGRCDRARGRAWAQRAVFMCAAKYGKTVPYGTSSENCF